MKANLLGPFWPAGPLAREYNTYGVGEFVKAFATKNFKKSF